MAGSVWAAHPSAAVGQAREPSRHPALVRVTHWLTLLAFLALLVSGLEIVVSHPRFYWGEAGNSLSPPLFKIPIPASRRTVPTGYGYVLPDQNGWSRYLHFQAAWALVLTGWVYVAYGFFSGHLKRSLVPSRQDLSSGAIANVVKQHVRFARGNEDDAGRYNGLQRLTYLLVIFGLFPLIVWTGLAMSPAIAAAAPWAVSSLGGQQSARTLHFFVTIALTAFLVMHVTLVWLGGFRHRVGAMITGRGSGKE